MAFLTIIAVSLGVEELQIGGRTFTGHSDKVKIRDQMTFCTHIVNIAPVTPPRYPSHGKSPGLR